MLDRPAASRARRRDTAKPKGRQVDDAALADVRRLLGERPRRRDLLIEHLHLIQDEFRCLRAGHIRALADEMRLSQVEVYEVASFYDHFDVVKEGEAVPPPLTIRVCDSVSCMLAGAEDLIAGLRAGAEPERVRVLRAPCMGGCDVAPAARIGDREVGHATAEGLLEMARTGRTEAVRPDHVGLDAYRARGGYGVWERVRSGELTPEAIIETLSDASLRGLGGRASPRARSGASCAATPARG